MEQTSAIRSLMKSCMRFLGKALVLLGVIIAAVYACAVSSDNERARRKAEFDKLTDKQRLERYLSTDGGTGEYFLYDDKTISAGNPILAKRATIRVADAEAADLIERFREQIRETIKESSGVRYLITFPSESTHHEWLTNDRTKMRAWGIATASSAGSTGAPHRVSWSFSAWKEGDEWMFTDTTRY